MRFRLCSEETVIRDVTQVIRHHMSHADGRVLLIE